MQVEICHTVYMITMADFLAKGACRHYVSGSTRQALCVRPYASALCVRPFVSVASSNEAEQKEAELSKAKWGYVPLTLCRCTQAFKNTELCSMCRLSVLLIGAVKDTDSKLPVRTRAASHWCCEV